MISSSLLRIPIFLCLLLVITSCCCPGTPFPLPPGDHILMLSWHTFPSSWWSHPDAVLAHLSLFLLVILPYWRPIPCIWSQQLLDDQCSLFWSGSCANHKPVPASISFQYATFYTSSNLSSNLTFNHVMGWQWNLIGALVDYVTTDLIFCWPSASSQL